MNNYHHNYLGIDPSGSGTTGLFIYKSKTKEKLFKHFKSKLWKDHFDFIKEICEKEEITYIIYETTNFIKVMNNDLTSLLKLFGAIESLTYLFTNLEKCETTLVQEVKKNLKSVKEDKKKIGNLVFKKGRGRGTGWFYKEKKITVHEVDAFLVLYCHLKKKFNFFDLEENFLKD